jgi:predicted membrane-bound spermidine synthase
MSVTASNSTRARSSALMSSAIIFCFFVSGFCSLLYQVLWTRLAFASFGIITPVLSLTVSTFMLGLGVGSIYGGRWAGPVSRRLRLSPLYLYAGAEAMIAAGAFAVPAIFARGAALLLQAGTASSANFLFMSAIFIVAALLPWCIAMGATFPLMMAFVRQIEGKNSKSFSVLYRVNVLGAASGAAITAVVLVELFGIRGAYMLGALGNITIALVAAITAYAAAGMAPAASEPAPATTQRADDTPAPAWLKPVLFITGFSCVGMEVCWARDFTLVLQTSIYAFAAVLTVYLLATCTGSSTYLRQKAEGRITPFESIAAWLFPLALLPIFLNDPRLVHAVGLTLISIVPLSYLLGYTTPALIDRFGAGDPNRTGRLYAINIAGGIFGPLTAGYLLLPDFSIRVSMIVMALPFAAAYVLVSRPNQRRFYGAVTMFAAALCAAVLLPRSYDEGPLYQGPHEVHRDYAASAVAYGAGMTKDLMVNGIHITSLTPVTKIMAHLPMALQGNPHRALDICFGMGTTFRSLASWNIDVTAVDLSSSVTRSFGFFHEDAPAILAAPQNHIITDDGRRFLTRTTQKFDVITIDPPPPVQAAGSSLLYSVQFYAVLRQRLSPHGILAQWVPQVDEPTLQSIALALHDSFPYIRVFQWPGQNGTHFIASMQPIPPITVTQFLANMPPAAQADLVEWSPGETPRAAVQAILNLEIPLSNVLPPPGSKIPALSDDRPFNEYFVLRKYGLLDLN